VVKVARGRVVRVALLAVRIPLLVLASIVVLPLLLLAAALHALGDRLAVREIGRAERCGDAEHRARASEAHARIEEAWSRIKRAWGEYLSLWRPSNGKNPC